MALDHTTLNGHEEGRDASDEQAPLLGAALHASTASANQAQWDDSKNRDGEIQTKSLALIMCSVWIGTFCAGLGRISSKGHLSPEDIC